MQSAKTLLFFTYADRRYELFALPYAYFALRNNPDSIVEICLEDFEGFSARYADGIVELDRLFGGRAVFRQAAIVKSYPGVIPNTVRFVEVPQSVADYLYIGDIDLLVFEDVRDVHLSLMDTYSLQFSNVLRPQFVDTGAPRLTGLHFVPYSDYYPLPDLSDLDLSKENDEHVLYLIMQRKGRSVPREFQVRPECGIHMSLSRDPLGRTTGVTAGQFSSVKTHGWGGRHYYSVFLKQIKEPGFIALLGYLNLELRLILLVAEAMATSQGRFLHRAAATFLLDKRLLIEQQQFTRAELYADRDSHLRERDFSGAARIGMEASLIWPTSIDVWFKQAWTWSKLGRTALMTEALLHIRELPGGLDFLRSTDFVSVNKSAIAEIGGDAVLLLRELGLSK